VLAAILGDPADPAARTSPSSSPRRSPSADERSPLWSSDVVLDLDGGRHIRVKADRVIRGDRLDEIEAIRPGGSLTAEEVLRGRTRRVEMHPCGECSGGISRRYTVDGQPQPYDAAAQRWLSGVLRTFLGN
ncbi:MAG TPA: hypothetical protein VFJ16_26590, partial [Longimicrobium sp.]|nr:hypothetical protein [Longimicrobium sp.]